MVFDSTLSHGNDFFRRHKVVAMSQLEYSKLILEKVSFDKRLFRKEYKKFCRMLRTSAEDLAELRKWVRHQYYTDRK